MSAFVSDIYDTCSNTFEQYSPVFCNFSVFLLMKKKNEVFTTKYIVGVRSGIAKNFFSKNFKSTTGQRQALRPKVR